MPRSSEIVLDFFVPNQLIAPEQARVYAALSALAALAAQLSESVLTRFAPEELAAKLKTAGFSKVVHFSRASRFRALLRGATRWSWRTNGPSGPSYAGNRL